VSKPIGNFNYFFRTFQGTLYFSGTGLFFRLFH
jgi:hypothetical protein